jgi:hypothetical protein
LDFDLIAIDPAIPCTAFAAQGLQIRDPPAALRIVTDKLRSYSAAMRSILGKVTHNVERYADN